MKEKILYVLYKKCIHELEEKIILYGIFSESEIKYYRNNISFSICLLVPLNKFVEKGVEL